MPRSTKIRGTNEDETLHTIIASEGYFDCFCILHPFMTGGVHVHSVPSPTRRANPGQ